MIGLQELLGAVMWGMTVFDDGQKNVVVVRELLCVCVCSFFFLMAIIKISRSRRAGNAE